MSKSEPVDETEEGAKMYVADPDDYAKTRKLKAINDTKAYVRKTRNDMRPGMTQPEYDLSISLLGQAVASYGHELLPLLLEAEENGTLEEDDFYATDGLDVRYLIVSDGLIQDGPDSNREPRSFESMAIYRQLQILERKLGLGLTLEMEQNTEWEIET